MCFTNEYQMIFKRTMSVFLYEDVLSDLSGFFIKIANFSFMISLLISLTISFSIYKTENILISVKIHLVSLYLKVIFEMEERLMKPLVLDRKVGREGKIKLSGGTFIQLQSGGIEDLIKQKRENEKGVGASNK